MAKYLVYIDLYMVRADVDKHPSAYGIRGYNEIQQPPKRYSIVNRQAFNSPFGIREENQFRQMHREWVNLELKNDESKRQLFWRESVAVGDEWFIQDIHQELSGRISGRSIVSDNGMTSLQEPQSSYGTLLEGQNDFLSTENAYFLHLTV